MPEKIIATTKRPRVVPVGDTDVHMGNAGTTPTKKAEMGRHCFEWMTGVQTTTYRLPYGLQLASAAARRAIQNRRISDS